MNGFAASLDRQGLGSATGFTGCRDCRKRMGVAEGTGGAAVPGNDWFPCCPGMVHW